MAIEKLKTKEVYSDSDMDISDIDDKGLVHIEATGNGIYDVEYTRIVINKTDAILIINHLKQQFGL